MNVGHTDNLFYVFDASPEEFADDCYWHGKKYGRS